MWILFKNISRYVFKKKFSLLGLLILILITVSVFLTFGLLSSNLTKSYNNLVKNGNLHNIVINENYNSDQDKTDFEKGLSNLGVAYRQFNSLDVTTNASDLFKIIEYNPDYEIDKLIVFYQDGLPKNSSNQPTLPKAIDFNGIIKAAQASIINPDLNIQEKQNSLKARQEIVYFAAKASWKGQDQYQKDFDADYQMFLKDPTLDPLEIYQNNPNITNPTIWNKVAGYLNIILNPLNPKYTPIVVNGYRISFDLTSTNNFGIPVVGFFDDYTSYLAVVSPTYLNDNHKKIYSYTNFLNDSFYQTNFSNKMLNEQSFLNYFDSIPSEYKVFVNSIPYLIVGSGISPAFMYPIINFENVIPNPQTQAVIYSNNNGYSRTQASFPTAPTEDMIVAKYNGPKPLNDIVGDINILAHKYMAFPSNTQIAYVYNDINNNFSPTGLRVSFVVRLVAAVQSISTIISIFVGALALFVMALFTKKFIEDNRTNIAIMLANGVKKIKILFVLSFISFIPAFFAGFIGFFIGFFTQHASIDLFSNYWMVPTATETFNFGYLILCVILPILIFFLLTFVLSGFILKGSVVAMMKDNNNFKLGKFTIFVKKFIDWAPALVKFRFSLAFSSIVKISVLIFMSTLTSVIILFISSTSSAFKQVISNNLKTNNSTFQVNLVTPTTNGGQYYAVDFDKDGQVLHAYPGLNDTYPHGVLNDLGYQNSGYYKQTYEKLANFRLWSGTFWPSALDSSYLEQDPTFLKNRTSLQMILNNSFGIGSLSSNPWNTVLAWIPSNQINTSINLNNQLMTAMMGDMVPINASWDNSLINSSGSPSNIPIDAIAIPQHWIIANIGIKDPHNWITNYHNSQNYGVINAQQIPQLKNLTLNEILKLPKKVIVDDINTVYSNLFNLDAVSDLSKLDESLINFDLNTNLNKQQEYLITPRTLFKQYFSQLVPADENPNNLSQVYQDPFEKTKEYYPKNSTIMSNPIISTSYSDAYINYVSIILNNPYYQQFLYKFSYGAIPWNAQNDEPYTYVNADIVDSYGSGTAYNKTNQIEILGIIKNSQYIHLTSENGERLNNLLFEPEENGVHNLVINAYAAKLYGLHIGQIINIKPKNDVNRYNPTFKAPIVKYRVVGINNTAHNAEFYTSMSSAQQTIGLITQKEYLNQSSSALNNQYNSFGGFNGIFTNNPAPYTLTNSIALYSPSGIYSGVNSFSDNGTFNGLINNLIKSYNLLSKNPTSRLSSNLTTIPISKNFQLIENAIFFTNDTIYNGKPFIQAVKEAVDLANSASPSDQAKGNAEINAISSMIINHLNNIYGRIAFNSIVEKPLSLENAAIMFNNLSGTITQIEIIISIIFIVLSIIIILLLSWMLINDLIRIAALLKTQGYSDFANAMNFFSIFIPTLIFTAGLTLPFTLLAFYLFKEFVFINIGVLLSTLINWWAYVLIILGFAAIFTGTFLIAMVFLKRMNLVEVLKW